MMLLVQVRREDVPLLCDDTWLWHDDDDADGADDGGTEDGIGLMIPM